MPLQFLDTDIEQTNARTMPAKSRMRQIGAHYRELDQVLRVAFDIGTEVKNDCLALHRRQEGSDRRPLDARQGTQHEFSHRHQGAGVPCRDDRVRLTLGNRVNRQPHAGIATAAQCLARLVVAGDFLGRMTQLAMLLHHGIPPQQRLHLSGITEQDEFRLRESRQNSRCAFHHHVRGVIPPHGVERNGQGRGHTVAPNRS